MLWSIPLCAFHQLSLSFFEGGFVCGIDPLGVPIFFVANASVRQRELGGFRAMWQPSSICKCSAYLSRKRVDDLFSEAYQRDGGRGPSGRPLVVLHRCLVAALYPDYPSRAWPRLRYSIAGTKLKQTVDSCHRASGDP
jgi:hypothetical protein